MQDGIKVQVGKFLKINKRAGWNFLQKLINVQQGIILTIEKSLREEHQKTI
jgi:hypothetical protein